MHRSTQIRLRPHARFHPGKRLLRHESRSTAFERAYHHSCLNVSRLQQKFPDNRKRFLKNVWGKNGIRDTMFLSGASALSSRGLFRTLFAIVLGLHSSRNSILKAAARPRRPNRATWMAIPMIVHSRTARGRRSMLVVLATEPLPAQQDLTRCLKRMAHKYRWLYSSPERKGS